MLSERAGSPTLEPQHRAARGTGARALRVGHAWRALALACLSLGLAGCLQSETLGGKAPDTVTIVGTPAWDNGVAALMGLKCAVCHQVPRPALAPAKTPSDIDLRNQLSVGVIRGGEDVASYITAGILRHDLSIKITRPIMPPEFATPVVEAEQASLEQWAAAVAPPNVGGSTSAAAGAVLYTRYCQGCHGVNAVGNAIGVELRGLNCPTTISQSIATVPVMYAWPGLTGLATDAAQLQALTNYLIALPDQAPSACP